MRKLPGILLIMLLWSCSSGIGNLEFKNPLPYHISDAGVTLKREDLAAHFRIPENKIPLILCKSDTTLVSQANDLNGDHVWDELFIMADYDSMENKEVQLKFVDPKRIPSYKIRTNIRLGDLASGYNELQEATRLQHAVNTETAKVFQMEGPAWENDHVGFRNYLDRRNGMDIFGKTTPLMVLDSVGIKGFPGYHDLSWWGMDVLKVDRSLGAGSIGFDLNDSIYRLGDNGTGIYKLLYEGPVRSAFMLGFSNWKLGGDSLAAEQVINIDAGTYCYESTVYLNQCEKPVLLVTGIVNKKSHKVHTFEPNGDYFAMYTLDHQAEDSTLLGMALLVSAADLVNAGTLPAEGEGITETYFVRLKITKGNPLIYRFYSFWEREDQRWTSRQQIEDQLRKDAERLSHPVEVNFPE